MLNSILQNKEGIMIAKLKTKQKMGKLDYTESGEYKEAENGS